MAIAPDVHTHAIGELLGEELSHEPRGMNLRIPDYQRPYEWTPDLALQLFDDLAHAVGPAGETSSASWEAVHETILDGVEKRPPYMIGSLILHESVDRSRDVSAANPAYDVVDGQQRLLTLLMLREELHRVPEIIAPLAAHEKSDVPSPALLVQDALRTRLHRLSPGERHACWQVISHRAQMVVITTDDLDEAFSIFDSQNTRGLGLAPHDLLKAHHLREMRHDGEAQRVAAIEKWENSDQDDLSRLFARYLYRIGRWSQGLEARSFTARDIDMFKGISPSETRTPTQLYHAAAQAMIPAIQQWDPSTSSSDADTERRRMNHARFRLDSPVIAGGPFFEMVDFFLEELRRLRHDERVVPGASIQEPPPDGRTGSDLSSIDWKAIFATGSKAGEELSMQPSRSTMFYVSELYLATMLYAVNCFGETAITEAATHIRRWAFYPRTVKYAVREDGIDLHSTGDQSLFPLIRRSRDVAGLLRHPVPLPQRDQVSTQGRSAGIQILLEAGVDPRSVYPDEESNS